MANAKWKPVDGYENLYEVSCNGEVRSMDRYVKGKKGIAVRRAGKMLKPRPIGDGYPAVYLPDEKGKQVWKYVHRLVATAFLPNPDNLPEVNHKDEDITNNNVKNLEWCDRKHNANWGTIKDRIKETNIKNGRWEDYGDMTEEEKKKERNRKAREKYVHKSNRRVVVYEIVKTRKKIGEFKDNTEAAKHLGVSNQVVGNAVRGKTKKPLKGKYIIKKVNNNNDKKQI